ncbi:uncharacterized protein M8220_017404 [Acridotheres tristis]
MCTVGSRSLAGKEKEPLEKLYQVGLLLGTPRTTSVMTISSSAWPAEDDGLGFWHLLHRSTPNLWPGSVDAEAALGSARALLGSALGTAGPALPSHGSDSFASDKPIPSTAPELCASAENMP